MPQRTAASLTVRVSVTDDPCTTGSCAAVVEFPPLSYQQPAGLLRAFPPAAPSASANIFGTICPAPGKAAEGLVVGTRPFHLSTASSSAAFAASVRPIRVLSPSLLPSDADGVSARLVAVRASLPLLGRRNRTSVAR